MISREKFQGQNFNAIDFYLSVKDLDLELIQEELKKIQKNVLEQVQDYVNAEYLNFLSLSRDLDFVEEELLEYSKEFYKLLNSVSEFDAQLLRNSQEAINLLKETQNQRLLKEKSKEKSLFSLKEISEIAQGNLVRGIVLFLESERFYQSSDQKMDEAHHKSQKGEDLDLKVELTNLLDSQLKETFKALICEKSLEQEERLINLFIGSSLLENHPLVANRFIADVLEPWMENRLGR